MKFYEKISNNSTITPSIFYLITSHHPPCQLNRTWRLNIMGHHVYLCTRCLGQYIGMIVGIIWVLFFSLRINNIAVAAIFYALLPLPSTGTWLVQTLYNKENTNPVRFLAGFSFGLSIGVALGHLLIFNLPNLLFIIPIFSLYLLLVMAVLHFSKIVPDYLAPYEHFLDNSSSKEA